MEIERKWIVKKIPDTKLAKLINKIAFERYFLFVDDTIEVRVQKINSNFEFERKRKISDLSSSIVKFEISEAEYNYFKSQSKDFLVRDCYDIAGLLNGSLKVYHGRHEGLIRAEVEFQSEDEAKKFVPLDWFGVEITNTDLGRDKYLIKLDKEKLLSLIEKYNQER